MKRINRIKKMLTALLCVCMILPLAVFPSFATEYTDISELFPHSSERFSAEYFEEESGRLIPYDSESLMFSIRSLGASFSFEPTRITGDTSCNAYRFVLRNYTASNKMTVTYRYEGETNLHTAECELEQTQEMQTCLVYIPSPERVAYMRVSFFGVRSGSVRLYSINPVSAYRPIPSEYGTLSSCVANLSDGTVTLTGRVLSGVTARFSDAKLLLYRLPFGTDAETYLADKKRQELASVKIASKFSFTVPAETAGDRLSRYIVTLLTNEGTETPLTGPTYVTSFGSNSITGNASGGKDYKGIIGEGTSTVISLGAGSTVVDVYLDRLISGGNSPYSYSSGGAAVLIDRTAVAELDAKIKAYTAAGCTVYLRYLISSDATDSRLCTSGETQAKYKGIFLSGSDSASVLYSVTDYLAERYGKQSFGKIGGVILGTGTDNATAYNDCGTLSLDAYVRNLAAVALTVRLGIAKGGHDMKVVIPVTDSISSEVIGKTERDGKYDKYLLLSGLAELFSESNYDNYSVLLESETQPYSLTTDEDGKLTAGAASGGVYTAANAKAFETLLKNSGANKQAYLFRFDPPADLTDAELIVSYLYSYYAFGHSDGPETVFVSLNPAVMQRLALVISRIGTDEGTGQEEFVLGVFGAKSEEELFGEKQTNQENRILTPGDGIRTEQAVGTYTCFDFSSALGTLNWNADPNVTGFGIGVGKALGRSLAATVDFTADPRGGIYYTFSYPEDMTLYDSLAFRFAVEDLDGERSVFEFCVTLYGDGFTATGSVLADAGGETEYSVATATLPGAVRAVRVTVRSVSGSDTACRFGIKDVVACSKTVNSEDLQLRVENAREEARKDAEGNSSGMNGIGVTVLAVLAVATILLTLFLVRQSKHRKNRPSEESFDGKQ